MDFHERREAIRRDHERIAGELRALQAIAARDGERIQALLRIAERRLTTLEGGDQ